MTFSGIPSRAAVMGDRAAAGYRPGAPTRRAIAAMMWQRGARAGQCDPLELLPLIAQLRVS
jgi:hypothetical protein